MRQTEALAFGVLADSDISSVINNHVSFIPCMNRPLTDDGYEVKFGFVSTTYQLNGFHFRKSSPFNSYSGISLTSFLFDVALLWKIGKKILGLWMLKNFYEFLFENLAYDQNL